MNTPEQDWEDRANSYSLSPDEELPDELWEAIENQDLDAVLAILEARETARIKQACIRGLLDLGIMPKSLVSLRKWGPE